jgi:hypothetical protein
MSIHRITLYRKALFVSTLRECYARRWARGALKTDWILYNS